MVTSKLEVLVDFGEKPDETQLNKTLNTLKAEDGVKEALFKNGAIYVETTLPSADVIQIIRNTSGKRAVLQGFGDQQSAVAMLSNQNVGSDPVLGVIRFLQDDQHLVVEGSVDGLREGGHGVQVRESGDLSRGCDSLGDIFNPTPSGTDRDVKRRLAGDLGCVVADENGRASFRIVDDVLKVGDIIGRSVAITDTCNENGQGDRYLSNGSCIQDKLVACGIIARASGVYQNPKRICQCDGVVVWDEHDKPLAGMGRRTKKSCCGKEKENGHH